MHPKITNVQTKYVPGIENPMTSYTIQMPAQNANANAENNTGPESWKDIPFVNTAGDGYGPHTTTFGQIAEKIPSKPALKKACDNCGKRPDQNGEGYKCCATCKIARYCSKECQTAHWKLHKVFCKRQLQELEMERDSEATALRDNKPYLSNTAMRQWYYENVDIVDYVIAQTLELYKGPSHDLWRTHAAVFRLRGGKQAAPATAADISFSDAEVTSFDRVAGANWLNIPTESMINFTDILRHRPASAPGAASKRVVLIFVPNDDTRWVGFEAHDLPPDGDEEWGKMEKDDMWRMHVRMRKVVQGVAAKKKNAE
ncbi:hypothetical protein FB45DRAFT_1065288 [Roridomyces roridus]|uniref:MYND-type domain-containing protein n=1 Tax=Roridomyces roridus TaxID=1738132 RepID=A0AAD7FB37_9AGAR|nr:hypothetical protein FB45DRAFT_1065288 [Roridomyces roridus]